MCRMLRRTVKYKFAGVLFLAGIVVCLIAINIPVLLHYNHRRAEWMQMCDYLNRGDHVRVCGIATVEQGDPTSTPSYLVIQSNRLSVGYDTKNWAITDELLRKIDGRNVCIVKYKELILRIDEAADHR